MFGGLVFCSSRRSCICFFEFPFWFILQYCISDLCTIVLSKGFCLRLFFFSLTESRTLFQIWFLDCCPMESPTKSRFSVCLFVCPAAVQHFYQESVLEISDFLDRGRWLEYLKSVRALFSRKIHFSQKLGKNCPKWHRNSVFWIFGKFLSLVFLGIFQNENYYSHWYFTINQICGKILVLELWAKMLLANRTAGFFKM